MTWAMVTVCGYVAAKPTIRHFERGTVLCSFPLYVKPPQNGRGGGSPLEISGGNMGQSGGNGHEFIG
jgi:hypothetical protein